MNDLNLRYSERVMYRKALETKEANTKKYSNERRMATYIIEILDRISRMRTNPRVEEIENRRGEPIRLTHEEQENYKLAQYLLMTSIPDGVVSENEKALATALIDALERLGCRRNT